MTALFVIFFLSGFCGLLYQVIWLRLAFAHFGVIAPVLSIVISVFMLGLGLGSWLGGRWVRRNRQGWPALRLYAASEACIGLGAWIVPHLFDYGSNLLLSRGGMDSWGYLAASAGLLAVSLIPWCFAMGLTFPLMMAAFGEFQARTKSSFSFLYLANTVGAMVGALMTAFVLVEWLGLRHTLMVAGTINGLIAGFCFFRSGVGRPVKQRDPMPENTLVPPPTAYARPVLFATAFAALGNEVLWTRDFTPVLGTTVYAFASIVAVYLAATWLGSWIYRRHLRLGRLIRFDLLLAGAAITAAVPVLLNHPGWGIGGTRALLSIVPFCALLGYLTPLLVDADAKGDPERAGSAYAINVIGCVIGPLVTSYLLLPAFGARWSMLLFAGGLLAAYFWASRSGAAPQRRAVALIGCLVAIGGALCSSYEERCPELRPSDRVVRDYTATVLCCGTGWDRSLWVNGIGMSRLAFVTKEMAHLPLASHPGKSRSALLICFGMGTTYRSLLSWGVQTTAVELVPSVPRMFDFFFNDAPAVAANPRGRVVIDDGRRFLKRTPDRYDVITIDPPPPVEASGSALLYSREFYELVKARLNPDGIFQQWWPDGEERILQAAARSLAEAFPHVRVFKGRGRHGFHFLAAMQPIQVPGAAVFLQRLPPAAARDIAEWTPDHRTVTGVEAMLSREIPLELLLPADRPAQITDDQPYNEYYVLRRLRDRLRGEVVYAN
jgi:spermidine synthase